MENTVTINKQEYIMLVRMAERIDTVERMLDRCGYLSDEAIRTILGIQKYGEASGDGEI